MIYIYILINLFYIIIGNRLYNRKINPISLYSLIWTLALILYEMKLVYYYDLTTTTWVVIILFQFVYNIGCFIGKFGQASIKNNKLNNDLQYINEFEERNMKLFIIVFSMIASISVISKLLIVVKTYGINLLQYTNQIYADRLNGNLETGIPYIGTFVYIALIFSGIYFKKYGFKKFILFPIILVALDGLYGAGRLGFVTGFFLILFPIIFLPKKRRNKKGISRHGKVQIAISLSILIVVFVIITNNRSTWITINPYMSPEMINLVEYNPSIYKNYTYITIPIGVLNEFLKDPIFNFGEHTFLTFINLLNNFGANIEVNQYQAFYSVPLSSNVGSYIRELIEDFTIPLALLVVFILGIVFSFTFSKMVSRMSYISTIWASTLAFVVIFSFFQWQFRSSTIWLILFFGSVASYMLERRIKLKRLRDKNKEIKYNYVN